MTATDVTDTWQLPIPTAARRRASAQLRIRRQADKLDQLEKRAGIPAVRDPDDQRPTLTAAQLRLVANLLDHKTWGQRP